MHTIIQKYGLVGFLMFWKKVSYVLKCRLHLFDHKYS